MLSELFFFSDLLCLQWIFKENCSKIILIYIPRLFPGIRAILTIKIPLTLCFLPDSDLYLSPLFEIALNVWSQITLIADEIQI